MIYSLRRTQWIDRPLEEVFTFFSNARNLETITPPWLNFRIVTPGEIVLREGATIQYQIGWRGIPIRWTTEIRHWTPPYRFVDVQTSGPYAMWHHTHRFERARGGTAMSDIVHYALPCGVFGRVAHALKVHRDLERIFDYRQSHLRI